jgi:Cu(I)/Ag(I) efflux system membrane fusion protein
MRLVPLYADEASSEQRSASGVAGYSTVSLPPASQQVIGVKLGKAEIRSLSRSTRTVGRVTVDERRLAQVRTKFDGFVEQLYVNFTGEAVRRGQPLMSVYSPDVLATENELILAARSGPQFRATLEEAARRRLLLWDMAPADIDRVARTGKAIRSIVLRSPANGVVLTKNVTAGTRVMPTDTLYEVGDLSRVWILADVYESDLPHIRIGQTAQVSVASLSGRSWIGRVTFISPTLDPVTRTAKMRIELDNPGGILKPDMYADVVLQEPIGAVVAVPESAVLQTGTRSIIFVRRGTGEFEPREVVTGSKADGFYEIRSGVSQGETVAVDANFLIDSESRLKAAVSKLGGTP